MKPSHSNIVRIASNYIRLATTLVIGLLVVRLLLRFGDDAYALVALLGTGTGMALMLKQVVRTSTVPILGEAFHSDRKGWFEQVFNSALLCSLLAGLLTLLFFVIFALCLPLLNFPDEFYTAALVFVIASGVHSFVNVSISPFTNFYIVSERMIAYNILLFLERFGDIVAVIATLLVLGVDDPSSAIITYGLTTASLYIVFNLGAAFLITRADPRLVPNRSMVSREAISAFLKSVGWNGCVIFAINLYARVDMVIMNLFFGLFGNMVFGLANQAVGYLRQLIFGLVSGMDAVAARMTKLDGNAAVLELMNRSTKLQSLIVFPAMVVLLVFGETLIELWLSGRLKDPEKTIPAIFWLMRILLFGVAARCLSEGWMSVMNGAGKVREYAIAVLVGGLLNPVLSVIAIKVFPETVQFAAVAIVFTTLMTIVHLVAIPWTVARSFRSSMLSIVSPIFKPAAIAIVCWVVSYYASIGFAEPVFSMIVFASVFGLTFVSGSYSWALDETDRSTVHRLLSRFFPFSNSTPTS
ncbi:MAG: hypothetical protein AAFN77_01490 [Planctomycetota bacterium]